MGIEKHAGKAVIMTKGTLGFVRQFLAKPKSTGAIFPSSPALAEKMLECAAPGENAVIAEYGPGTGAVTRPIMASLKQGQKFFAVEINKTFAARLKKEFPSLGIHVGCASGIAEHMAEEGADRIDCVISGLPWAVFPDDLQERILDGMAKVMPAGGVFVTFAYAHALFLPPARRFKRRLLERFSKFEKSDIVLANVPPAYVYRCER